MRWSLFVLPPHSNSYSMKGATLLPTLVTLLTVVKADIRTELWLERLSAGCSVRIDTMVVFPRNQLDVCWTLLQAVENRPSYAVLSATSQNHASCVALGTFASRARPCSTMRCTYLLRLLVQILLLVSTSACLLVWTVVDPWTWERDEIVGKFPPESFGKCSSGHFRWYFSVLSTIMILATSLAFGMAWKTKDLKIDSRYSDTNTVFLAIASQLQAWFGTSTSSRQASFGLVYAWYP
jgi:hypothetical protein